MGRGGRPAPQPDPEVDTVRPQADKVRVGGLKPSGHRPGQARPGECQRQWPPGRGHRLASRADRLADSELGLRRRRFSESVRVKFHPFRPWPGGSTQTRIRPGGSTRIRIRPGGPMRSTHALFRPLNRGLIKGLSFARRRHYLKGADRRRRRTISDNPPCAAPRRSGSDSDSDTTPRRAAPILSDCSYLSRPLAPFLDPTHPPTHIPSLPRSHPQSLSPLLPHETLPLSLPPSPSQGLPPSLFSFSFLPSPSFFPPSLPLLSPSCAPLRAGQ